MAIPQSFIQELLARADVVEIVGRYVQLKKGGANFMGLCPFHSEKSPSFSVSPSKQFFHCFGCGKNGNAIGFLMEHAGMRSEEHTSELQSPCNLVCRLLLEKKKNVIFVPVLEFLNHACSEFLSSLGL